VLPRERDPGNEVSRGTKKEKRGETGVLAVLVEQGATSLEKGGFWLDRGIQGKGAEKRGGGGNTAPKFKE